MVLTEKWSKTQALVRELSDLAEEAGERGLPQQRLLEIRGFLNYVVRTYPWMNPYLKGLHLAIDGLGEEQEEGGWKPSRAAALAGRRVYDADLEGGTGTSGMAQKEGPEFVEP
jgi:hypothetical protein